MALFDQNGCLTDAGLLDLTQGRLDELGRLEAAEHLSYCDRCLDRYTALLARAPEQQPLRPMARPVLGGLLVRVMGSTMGRSAVAGVAAVLALTLWGQGLPALASLDLSALLQPAHSAAQRLEHWQDPLERLQALLPFYEIERAKPAPTYDGGFKP